VYARDVLHRETPRVGLLSNGEEETKGNEVTVETHKMLRQTDLNFLGNVEGNHVYSGDYDVIVTDGFAGNILLKASEGLAAMVFRAIKQEVGKSITTMLGAAMMMPAAKRVKARTDYDEYGGAPILGLNGVVIKAHGRSNKKAYMNALRVAAECYNLGLVRRLREELERVDKQLSPVEVVPRPKDAVEPQAMG
jgi:glycerol-3-phosphate acyltransferase PlsX